MNLRIYAAALIDQWERGIRDAEDVVRDLRNALAEEAEIEAAEQAEADAG